MDSQRRQLLKSQERWFSRTTFVFSLVTILISVGIVYALITETYLFFSEVSFWDFLTDPIWAPVAGIGDGVHFGVRPLIAGTLLVTLGAMIIAIPLGLVTAIFLSEYAPPILSKILKPTLEMLAGIPSVVYGFFALTFITPLLQQLMPTTNVFNALSASIAMGFMILPLVTSFSQDAMQAVPNSLRSAGYALGLTKKEVALGIVVPAARSGIVASFVLAISRAIGETMIVAMAAGAFPNMSFNPLEPVMTLTGFIAMMASSDVEQGITSYHALYAVGLLLFLFTLVTNIVSQRVMKSARKWS